MVVPLSLGAAPSTSEDPSLSPATQPDGQTLAVGALRPGDPGGGARAVELLIQMQQRSAGLEFNERLPLANSLELRLRPATVLPGKSSPPPAVEEMRTPASGLFGSGATPTIQSDRSSGGDTRVPSEIPAVGGAGRPSRGAASGEPPPLWLLFPREVIEYVRENRGVVAAGVAGLLLLFWGASTAFSRRSG